MAKVRARRETDTLYLDFFFQGKRCREQTSLVDSVGNRRRLQAVLDRLTKEIKAGTFDYAGYFPNSRNAAHFSSNPHAAAVGLPSASVLGIAPASIENAPLPRGLRKSGTASTRSSGSAPTGRPFRALSTSI